MGTGVTVWFTDLPSAGNTTIANLVEKRLAAGYRDGEGRPQRRW